MTNPVKNKDRRIQTLEKALEVAHHDLIKWGANPETGATSESLNRDLGKISYVLNNLDRD